jgi:hypothetical protein
VSETSTRPVRAVSVDSITPVHLVGRPAVDLLRTDSALCR